MLVVGVAGRERLLEDRRVRRDADDRVAIHHLRELAALENVAGQVVEPDALPVLTQFLQSRLRHLPFPSPLLFPIV